MDQLVNKALYFGRFALDLTRGCLRVGDADVELRPKTFEVLRLLAENAERLVSKDEISRKIWPGVTVSDDSLVQCIRELRLKLGDQAHRLIKTVQRRGYMLDAPVAEESAVARIVDATRDRGVTLVVLPLQNLTGDAKHDYFVDAVTVDLTTGLSRFSGNVIASSTALTYKSKQIDVRQVGRELGVRYAVEAAVHRSGDSIRVTARLIDAPTAAILWTDAFDLDGRDLERLRDDVTARLSRILNLELLHARGQRSLQEHPNNPDAIDFVIRAHALWVRTPGGHDLIEVRRLFQQAIELDASLASAWAGLAVSYIRNVRFSATHREDMEAARAAAERAMALGPQLALSNLAAGWVHYESGRMPQALVSFEHAAELDRHDPYIRASIGAANVMLGHSEQALEAVRIAMRLSPKDHSLPVWQMFMGVALLHLGRHAEAVDWLTRSAALDTGDGFTHLFLGSALALAGRTREAKAEITELLRLRPGLTLAKFKSVEPSDAPAFVAQRSKVYEGLLLAGLPR
jgi:adenylate cyclase